VLSKILPHTLQRCSLTERLGFEAEVVIANYLILYKYIIDKRYSKFRSLSKSGSIDDCYYSNNNNIVPISNLDNSRYNLLCLQSCDKQPQPANLTCIKYIKQICKHVSNLFLKCVLKSVRKDIYPILAVKL
jgi:hypothetical protein